MTNTRVAPVLLLAVLVACDEPPPIVCLDIPPRDYEVYVGDETTVTPCFTGGALPLAYTAESSDLAVATVSRVAGRAVIVTGEGVGAARIAITATDANGKTGEQFVHVGVPNRAPEIGEVEVDVPLWAERRLALADYATDLDRQELTYKVTSGTPSTLDVRVVDDTLYLGGVGRGTATLDFEARDESGVATSATFTGAISDPVAYVTQGSHSRQRDVPLAAGRQGLARVFLATDSLGVVAPAVSASLETSHGELVREISLSGPSRLPPQIAEGELEQSFNALIEGADLMPGVRLVVDIGATVDPNVPRRVVMPMEVLNVPVLNLTLVPIAFGEDDRTTALVDQMAADPTGNVYMGGIFEMLPVVDHIVSVREPLILKPLRDNSPRSVLLALGALYEVEGRGGHYLGIIPSPLVVETQNRRALVGGAAWQGAPIAFSYPSRKTVAHELGHNFNLLHAPCGGPSATDLRFPHRGGSIGVWGYDFANRSLYEPDTRDLMGYCSPVWISDYHFEKALRFRVEIGRSPPVAPQEETLMVWGWIGEDGVPVLRPSFYTRGVPTPVSAGGHRVTGRGPAGELFSFEFEASPMWDAEGSVFTFMVPVTWEGDLETITLRTPAGESAVLDGETDDPLSLVIENGRVRRFAAEQIAPEGTPGVIFTRGVPVRR